MLGCDKIDDDNQENHLQNMTQQREKRMKIIRRTCTPTRSLSSNMIRKRQQDYESNKKIIVKLVLSKINNSRFKRSNSIPNVHADDNINNELNNQINNEEEEEVLSPRKILKNAYSIPKQYNGKNTRQSSQKQKVVILSSSNLSSMNNTRTRDLVKAKISQKIESTLQTCTVKTNEKKKINMQCTVKPIIKKQKLQPIIKPAELQAEILEKCTKRIDQQIKIENCIMSDVQILRLFPRIDLNVLVEKIKLEQHYRKQQNICKWAHFAYCNVSQ